MNDNEINRIVYDGSAWAIFGIWINNLFLSAMTLGAYSFWGKTRMRRYVAKSFHLQQDRFEYVGTGKELFIGFCIVAVVVFSVVIIASIYLSDAVFDGLVKIFSLLFFPLSIMAFYSATRYRYSRTTWRGIRGRLTGDAGNYAMLQILRWIVNIVSLGLLIPITDITIHRYFVKNTYFGSEQVAFDGEARGIMSIHLLTWIVALPTLGLSRFWYNAALYRYTYAHTTIGDLRFKATHTGPSLMGLIIGNIAITVLTLGLGRPLVIHRNLKYVSDNLYLVGNVNDFSTTQSKEKPSKIGEGFEQVFDSGTGLM